MAGAKSGGINRGTCQRMCGRGGVQELGRWVTTGGSLPIRRSSGAVAVLEERSGSGSAKLEVPDQPLHALPGPWSGHPLLPGSPLPWQGPTSGNGRWDSGWWHNGQQEIRWWQRTGGGSGAMCEAGRGGHWWKSGKWRPHTGLMV